MILIEVAAVACHHYLISLLEILFRHEIVRNLGRQCIECNPFQMVGEVDITCDLYHFLQRIHQFHCRTKFGTLSWIIAMQSFVTAIHSLGLTVKLANITESTFHCIEICLVRFLLIIDDRFFDALRQVDAMNCVDASQVTPVHHVYKTKTLFMDQFAKIKEERISGDIIKPIHSLKIITSTEFCPKGPVAQWFFR